MDDQVLSAISRHAMKRRSDGSAVEAQRARRSIN
jgi:hypothetical protein